MKVLALEWIVSIYFQLTYFPPHCTTTAALIDCGITEESQFASKLPLPLQPHVSLCKSFWRSSWLIVWKLWCFQCLFENWDKAVVFSDLSSVNQFMLIARLKNENTNVDDWPKRLCEFVMQRCGEKKSIIAIYPRTQKSELNSLLKEAQHAQNHLTFLKIIVSSIKIVWIWYVHSRVKRAEF